MLEIKGLTKCYANYVALDDVTFCVPDGCIYGLLGYNGAGKTTLLKTVAAVLLPDDGQVLIDGKSAHECKSPERTPFIIADEPYFLPQATLDTMRVYYSGYYPHWSNSAFKGLCKMFGLSPADKVSSFSKGMQRQAAILLGLSTGAKTILLDESFDGLDLSKRILLKRLLREYARSRKASVILSSHNLRELDDVVDRLGMIDNHKLIFDETVDALHSKYPGKSLEEIFLLKDAKEVTQDEIEAIFK